MNVLSLFSGAGGLCSLGLGAAGHTVVGMCEIEPVPASVLRRHHPDVPIHDDVTTLDPKALTNGTRVDLVAGGSPCQDLSVAGRRSGLDGERSGLFWHQCRIAAEVGARWILWENVAGALSSNEGRDFAAVLWGLTGTFPDVPEDGWRSAGVCVGPERTAVWRLLDARWFGVPQRRRRVFVVVGPRAECGPEILLEPESCGGDSGPEPQAREEVAGTLGGGAGSRGWSPDTDRMTFVPAVSFNWQGAVEQGADVQTEFTGSLATTRHPAALTAEQSVRRLTPRECERLMGWPEVLEIEGERHDDIRRAIQGCRTQASATFATSDLLRPLWEYGEGGATSPRHHEPARRVRGAVSFLSRQDASTPRGLGAGAGASGLVCCVRFAVPAEASTAVEALFGPGLLGRDGQTIGAPSLGCSARLSGWTQYDEHGNEIADSHRYRMCGNGVVAPVAEWIGHRLTEAAP